MSKFKITSITCLNQQEEGHGNDEIYFKLNDVYGSTPNYTSNVMYELSPNPKAPYHTVHPGEVYNFTGEVKVEIWEYDAGSNADELLQSFTVDVHNQEHDFWQRSGALYDIYHTVA